MSFNAFDANHKDVDISAGIPKDISIEDTFFCYGCNCNLHIKAINSTKRAAHFAGHHESWCDEIDTKTTDNDHIANYRLTNQSLQSFLSKIQADDVKTKNERTRSSQTSDGSTLNHVANSLSSTDSDKDIRDIHSVCQLFTLFKKESFNRILYDHIRICDVYCGPSTKHIYTKYITGIHLVHAQYNWRNLTRKELYFCFPTVDNVKIKIRVRFSSDELFENAVELLREHYKKPVLIFADFNDSRCVVTSLAQLVPVKR